MSECVVRMDMPVDKRCPFDFNLPKMGPWCWIEDKSCSYWESNVHPSWCPIICSLPEGHGRMIDADALIELLEKKRDSKQIASWKVELVREALSLAKTIIPAEAERSENDGK